LLEKDGFSVKEMVWAHFWTSSPKAIGCSAYVAGFFALNAVNATNSEISFAGKEDLDDIRPFGRVPIKDTSIIKENGIWKWYGNQRDAIPLGVS